MLGYDIMDLGLQFHNSFFSFPCHAADRSHSYKAKLEASPYTSLTIQGQVLLEIDK